MTHRHRNTCRFYNTHLNLQNKFLHMLNWYYANDKIQVNRIIPCVHTHVTSTSTRSQLLTFLCIGQMLNWLLFLVFVVLLTEQLHHPAVDHIGCSMEIYSMRCKHWSLRKITHEVTYMITSWHKRVKTQDKEYCLPVLFVRTSNCCNYIVIGVTCMNHHPYCNHTASNLCLLFCPERF